MGYFAALMHWLFSSRERVLINSEQSDWKVFPPTMVKGHMLDKFTWSSGFQHIGTYIINTPVKDCLNCLLTEDSTIKWIDLRCRHKGICYLYQRCKCFPSVARVRLKIRRNQMEMHACHAKLNCLPDLRACGSYPNLKFKCIPAMLNDIVCHTWGDLGPTLLVLGNPHLV